MQRCVCHAVLSAAWPNLKERECLNIKYLHISNLCRTILHSHNVSNSVCVLSLVCSNSQRLVIDLCSQVPCLKIVIFTTEGWTIKKSMTNTYLSKAKLQKNIPSTGMEYSVTHPSVVVLLGLSCELAWKVYLEFCCPPFGEVHRSQVHKSLHGWSFHFLGEAQGADRHV